MAPTIFEILTEGFAEQGIDALLIGGYALSAYGVVRQTVDVDWLMADVDSGKLYKILSSAGYMEKARTENFIRYTHQSGFLMDIDVLLVDRSTFDQMIQQSRSCRIDLVELRIPCLAHLIALKLHAIKNNQRREFRDLGDIVELLKSNPGQVPTNDLATLCSKYGPKGIYSKLEAYLQ